MEKRLESRLTEADYQDLLKVSSKLFYSEDKECEKDVYVPLLRHIFKSFYKPAILEAFISTIGRIAPSLYKKFCLLTDIFELDRLFFLQPEGLSWVTPPN